MTASPPSRRRLAEAHSDAKVVFEEYAPPSPPISPRRRSSCSTRSRISPAARSSASSGPARNPLAKIEDLKPERYGIAVSPGGNILPAMVAYKQFPGMEGAIYYYYGFPKNPMNDWLVAEHQKRFNMPPDFFTCGGMAAASAVVTAIKKAGGTDTEKLIGAMEGMEFDTPKGKMMFRKEDHQALQSMYVFKVKAHGTGMWRSPRTRPRDPDRRKCRCRSATNGETATARPAVLETHDLTISFGGHVAVNAVSCAFHPGTLTAIVGPNGAGKTTYFNLISGQLKATAGRVLFQGADITALAPSRRARLGLGRAFQLTNLFPHLSVHENVRLAVQSRRGVGLDLFRTWGAHTELIAAADDVLRQVGMSARRNVIAGLVAARRPAQARSRHAAGARAVGVSVRRADRRHERRRGSGHPRSHRRHQDNAATAPSSWSSTRWTWCARSPTASSCCITANWSPTAIRRP